MDTDSFTVNIKTEDINIDIAKDVETRFDASIYELDKRLPKRKWKTNIIGLMGHELGVAEFAALRLNVYSYLAVDNEENKKGKGKKNQNLKLKIINIV